ncbi:phage major capsid protein [Virgibacillus pantothenticus]|uniref:Head protein n=1 Tax=Virgibacillus pantothenticus TaxID=1473 RepID=A0A0L0QV67_VIRPA|nr:phage major capsid protein [Virgibacillus pantothenticus]KNE22474.1 head protein [Virgibacillus pantothenticus]MED3738092.1 phage major capsid protein [Virgibacillus pantothenticus]QTY16941.1 phage major capsid protein [Virgibacillus pantothenticus]SIT16994.1 phage major capsid protein, HK97 family [Virgibacillus pantothenticus]
MPTFNPDHVMLQDAKTGKIPQEQGTLMLRDVMSNSVMMRLAQYEEMTKQEKEFQYLAEGVGAYWVGEGEVIRTSKPQWLTAKMVAKKLGVIVPVSREFLQYTLSGFFNEVRPLIAEAFYKKFDEATILGVDNPFPQSLAQSITTEGQLAEGEINSENFFTLTDFVNDAGFDINAFVSKKQNRSLLRNIVDGYKQEDGTITDPQRLYDRTNNTLDGSPVVDLESNEMKKGELFAGNFNYVRYGIPYNLNYSISEDAQLSSIVDENGDPINLFERELIAIRASMDVGFMVLKDDAFAKIQPATTP